MAKVEAEFTIIAKDSEGQAIYDEGKCVIFRIEESLIDVFTNIYESILSEFVLRHLRKDDDELAYLKQYTVILENFKFEWE